MFILLSMLAGFFICLCVYFAVMTCCVCDSRNSTNTEKEQATTSRVQPTAESKLDSCATESDDGLDSTQLSTR